MTEGNERAAALYVAGLGQASMLLEPHSKNDPDVALACVLGIISGCQGTDVAFQRGCTDAIVRWSQGEDRPAGGHLRAVT
jgi:hypothetical protein